MRSLFIYILLLIVGFLGQLFIGNTIVVTGITFALGFLLFRRQKKGSTKKKGTQKPAVATSGDDAHSVGELAQAFRHVDTLYSAGLLDESQYADVVDSNMMVDEAGRYWSYGAESGEWYRYSGDKWVKASPEGKLEIRKKSV